VKTTRPAVWRTIPRPDSASASHRSRGRREGRVDYQFVDSLAFQQKIDRGELVEWAEVHGHFYGSPREGVEAALKGGGIVVFDIDVQGGRSIQRRYPEAVLVFVLPPTTAELERRLRDRGTETEDSMRRRMLAARAEMEHGARTYDYLLVNDAVEQAYAELEAVVTAERCKRGRVDLSELGILRDAPEPR
jgi:guanylate kinase